VPNKKKNKKKKGTTKMMRLAAAGTTSRRTSSCQYYSYSSDLSRHPSDQAFRQMQASDPELLTPWIAHYQELVESSNKSFRELENALLASTNELKTRMFPVFLEKVQTEMLPSNSCGEVQTFYQKHPFLEKDDEDDGGNQDTWWETASFPSSFLQLAVDHVQQSEDEQGLLDSKFLFQHGEELWTHQGLGPMVQSHHQSWKKRTVHKIQTAVGKCRTGLIVID
jgi:hypothetical protein